MYFPVVVDSHFKSVSASSLINLINLLVVVVSLLRGFPQFVKFSPDWIIHVLMIQSSFSRAYEVDNVDIYYSL